MSQDNLTLGGLNLQAGLRVDFYRGLTAGNSLEPRLGVSYLFKPTNTVLRVSYSKFYETPYNENLLVSSDTGAGGLASNVFGAFGSTPLESGHAQPVQRRAFSRASASTSSSTRATSGSTPTTRSISTTSSIRRSRFPSSGARARSTALRRASL